MKRNCKHTTTQFVDAMTLGFTGVAGFNFWEERTLKSDGTPPTNLWQHLEQEADVKFKQETFKIVKQ